MKKIKKTSDNGATWVDVFDGATTSGVEGYSFDALNRMYVVTGNGKVVAQNQFTSSWFDVYDYSLINNYDGNSLLKLLDCGNVSKVCAIGHYRKSIEGEVHQLIPLVVP